LRGVMMYHRNEMPVVNVAPTLRAVRRARIAAFSRWFLASATGAAQGRRLKVTEERRGGRSRRLKVHRREERPLRRGGEGGRERRRRRGSEGKNVASARERKRKSEEERKERAKRGQRRVYDVTQVTYEIIIGLRDPIVRAAPRSPLFHLSISRSLLSRRARLFSPLAFIHPLHRPPSHRLSARFLHFSFIYLDDRATVIFCLRAPRSRHVPRSSSPAFIPRPRDDAALSILVPARTRVCRIGGKSVSRSHRLELSKLPRFDSSPSK